MEIALVETRRADTQQLGLAGNLYFNQIASEDVNFLGKNLAFTGITDRRAAGRERGTSIAGYSMHSSVD